MKTVKIKDKFSKPGGFVAVVSIEILYKKDHEDKQAYHHKYIEGLRKYIRNKIEVGVMNWALKKKFPGFKLQKITIIKGD